MIGFSDIYFQEDDQMYYWRGYENHRKGESAGAGRTYTKKFLEKINYNLFPLALNKGLDSLSWNIVKRRTSNIHITSLKEHGLLLVDIKDGDLSSGDAGMVVGTWEAFPITVSFDNFVVRSPGN